MSDLWNEAQEGALVRAWCAEIADALGGVPDDELRRVLIVSIAQSRALVLELDVLIQGRGRREAPRSLRRQVATCVVRMATYLRALGLTRHDVRRLDLGRRRGAAVH